MANNEYPLMPEQPELPEIPEIPPIPECPPIPELPPIPKPPSNIEILANGALKIIDMLSKSINQQTIDMIESVNRAVQAYTTSTLSQLAETAVKLIDAIANFKFPTLTDEEAEQLVESHRMWGQYGWTYIPSMPMAMFDTPPVDIKEANKLAMQYCSSGEMNKLFEDLQKWDLNKKDVESAVFCYQNRQYKACALLLCGLIDSKVIRVRSDEKRPTGERAVKAIKDNYDGSGEKILAEAMFTYNLLSYLEVLFAKAHGFKNEPDTLNRHYIGHGMNRRSVRKRDCIQLFLALNNLMQFFELGL